MNLSENIEFIERLKRFGIKSGLESIYRVMEVLGNPHTKFKSVHIAGTNGKGSTSTMIASILKEAGYKVGLYLSPYTISFNERMQINNIPISDKELEELITRVRKEVEKINIEITFFEFITAVAFFYFAEQKVNIAVVEVGMGGRLDATNVIDSLVSVITNIGIDHKEYLGNTKEKIAKEKAGIIKRNQVCVTAEEEPEIRDIFSQACKDKNSRLLYVNNLLKLNKLEESLDYLMFTASGVINGKFKLKLLGDHQIRNASVAILVCHELEKVWNKIPSKAISGGLEKAVIRGRMEVYSTNPLIIIDGAHNLEGAIALKKYISCLKNRKVLVMGTSKDKNSKEMIRELAPLFKTFIATEGRFKSKDAFLLGEEAKEHCKEVLALPNTDDAIKEALAMTQKNETMLITGSLYLIAGAIESLDKLHK